MIPVFLCTNPFPYNIIDISINYYRIDDRPRFCFRIIVCLSILKKIKAKKMYHKNCSQLLWYTSNFINIYFSYEKTDYFLSAVFEENKETAAVNNNLKLLL